MNNACNKSKEALIKPFQLYHVANLDLVKPLLSLSLVWKD